MFLRCKGTVHSLVEEFKCATFGTELLLSGSKDGVVIKVIPNPIRGRKWNPRMTVQEPEATLRHAKMVGNVQIGRGGSGPVPGKLVWSRAEKRKVVVDQVRRQEEVLKDAKAVAQAKQGERVNWERKYSRRREEKREEKA